MNSENVDTEPSLQMHKLPSVLFCGGGGGGGGGGGPEFCGGGGRGWQSTHFFRGGGVGRVHSAQGTTQFVDHKLTRILQKEH